METEDRVGAISCIRGFSEESRSKGLIQMFDCPRCMDGICTCGHQYEEWSKEDLKRQISMLQGVLGGEHPLGAAASALLTGASRTMIIYQFENAPDELKALSSHDGDEEVIIVDGEEAVAKKRAKALMELLETESPRVVSRVLEFIRTRGRVSTMTVAQLIAKLEMFDREAEVRFYGGGSGRTEACTSVGCVRLNHDGEVSEDEMDRKIVLIG